MKKGDIVKIIKTGKLAEVLYVLEDSVAVRWAGIRYSITSTLRKHEVKVVGELLYRNPKEYF
jgi:hypothetical protein